MKRFATVLLALSILSFGACKKDEAAKPVDTAAKPADPAVPAEKPADPAAKPADPAAKPADPTAKPADPAAAGAPLSPESEALGKQMIDIMTKMANIFDADKADCKKMGTDLKAFVDANKDAMAKLKVDGEKLGNEQKDAFMKAHQADFQTIMGKMMGGATACKDDAGVKAAMESFKM